MSEQIGKKVSREEALRISRETIENAERQRKECAVTEIDFYKLDSLLGKRLLSVLCLPDNVASDHKAFAFMFEGENSLVLRAAMSCDEPFIEVSAPASDSFDFIEQYKLGLISHKEFERLKAKEDKSRDKQAAQWKKEREILDGLKSGKYRIVEA